VKGGDNMLMLNMLERMALITVFTYIILKTNIMRYLVKDEYNRKDKTIIIILFSILSILGTYFGIYITDNSLANSRPIGAIVAGYLGGPAVGIIVGSISGLHRYSLGGFTALACALSTVAEGAIGGGFRKLFKNKGLSPLIAGLSAILAEITQMIIILIFSKDLNAAIELEKTIALSMIVINPIGVFLIITAIDSSKRLVDGEVKLLKLKEENKIAELKALKAQIEPHFLFNALNVIGAYCRTDGDKAKELILNLSNYFRSTLEIEGDFSTLERELVLIKAYVTIEEARFLNRLEVKFEIDENLLNMKFPILLLQPIVENSIKHGILKKIDGGIVSIKIEDKEIEVFVKISDNGVGFENAEKSQSTGIGIININNRLKLLYGEKYKLDILSSNSGSSVSFFIPK
jgi:two-component system LytT family sensor kinase/two-component system sensor histidine kinase LytS